MREVQVLSLLARTMKHPGANRAAVIEGGGEGGFLWKQTWCNNLWIQ